MEIEIYETYSKSIYHTSVLIDDGMRRQTAIVA